MQRLAANAALEKCGRALSEVDFVFAGDLLNQCIASGYGARGAGVPFIGLYGACSTYAEASALGAVFADGPAKLCLAVASSHLQRRGEWSASRATGQWADSGHPSITPARWSLFRPSWTLCANSKQRSIKTLDYESISGNSEAFCSKGCGRY